MLMLIRPDLKFDCIFSSIKICRLRFLEIIAVAGSRFNSFLLLGIHDGVKYSGIFPERTIGAEVGLEIGSGYATIALPLVLFVERHP